MKKNYQKLVGWFSLVLFCFFFIFSLAKAEQTGTSGESGVTSYLKTTYNSLVSLGYGSDSAGSWGDWGAYWNRIRSAAEWVPSSAATASDVRSGKTFYTNSRTPQTGTYDAVSNCSTNQYIASHASATKGNNCGLDWITANPAVDGDEKQDPRTGLVWSQNTRAVGGSVQFSTSLPSNWSWDASDADNISVGNKTATQLCSDLGNGWRLPTQKELMQAYVDGAYWAFASTGSNAWSITEVGNGTQARYVNLSTGYTSTGNFATGYNVRCVR